MGNPPTPTTIGQKLREARRDADLTQEALAYKAGVSLPTVQRIEADRQGSSRVATLAAIADALNLPVTALLEPVEPNEASA